ITSGLLALSRTLGQTTGLPLIGALFTANVLAFGHLPAGTDVTTASPAALVAGIHNTFQIAALVILVSTLIAVAAIYLDQRYKSQSKESVHSIAD
ncbi:MAG: MFS transporter, partial [Chloroflexi bacterium]|nr:MFS transporter [Chloroflexota bacterium]